MPRTSVGDPHPRHGGLEAAPAGADVVEVHGLADHQVAVGVEAADELVAVVVEVALDLEALPQAGLVVLALGQLPAEAVGERVVGPERHLGHHAGDGQPLVGTVAGLGVVVVAAAPAGVEPDRPPADRAPGDLLRRGLRAGGDGDERPHPVRVGDAPLEHLHAAHRAAEHREPALDPQVVGQAGLHPDHVPDGDDGERRAVRPAGGRIGRRRTRWSPGSPRATLAHTTK